MIRPAAPDDVDAVLALVRELAVYEREPDAVQMSPTDLAEALFSPVPAAYCHVATNRGGSDPDPAGNRTTDGYRHEDGEIVGFALWYVTFSTWTGRPGIHLEDLFVRPAHRRAGHGRTLLATLAAICAERGYSRLEWSVLDWNISAQAFYRALGGAPTAGWDRWRLDGAGLTRLARSAEPGGNHSSRPFLIT